MTRKWTRPGLGGAAGLCGLVLLLMAPMSARAQVEDDAAALSRARAALHDGLYELAERQLRDILADREGSGTRSEETVLLLARALAGQQKYDAILETLKVRRQWLRREEDSGPFVYWRALARRNLEGCEAAMAELADFETRFPGDPYTGHTLRLRARCAEDSGNIDDALALYERADAALPAGDERAANALDWGRALLSAGQPERAVTALQRVTTDGGSRGQEQLAQIWRARALRELDRNAEAGQLVEALLSTNDIPADLHARALLEAAEVQVALTNLNGAAAALSNAVAVAVDPTLKNSLEGRLGRLLLELGELDEGARVIRPFVAHQPRDPLAGPSLLRLAFALLDGGRYDEAVVEFQNYLESFDDPQQRPAALEGKAWALLSGGRLPEASAAFAKAFELHTDPARREQCLFKSADALFMNEQFRLAREAYERVIAEFPEGELTQRARFQAAECLVRSGEGDAAESMFLDVATAAEGTELGEEALYRIAASREARGQWDAAAEAYDRVMTQYTNGVFYARALHGRGMIRYRQYRFDEAASDFERVISQFGDSDVAEQSFYMRGMSYYGLMRDEDAIAVCRQFVERYPSSRWLPDVLFWLGRYEYNRGNFAEAEDTLLRVAAAQPDNALADDALLWAGVAASKQKEYVRSVETLTRLIKEYPTSRRVVDARFHQGDALCELGRFSAAILVFDEIIAKYPQSSLVPAAWGRKGDCQFTLGAEDPERYEESIASYRVVTEGASTRADMVLQANYKIGRCLEKLGRPTEAMDQYYLNVILLYLEKRKEGVWYDPTAKVWLTRAVFNAADIMEARRDWRGVVNILEKAVSAGVPAAEEAAGRIRKIRSEHWWLFY